eukprot:TRINITY_DN15607_c0_g1_i1.p1 TRINITY_DN15607_c0_g1~~TRINITY_DN15607_c0_g1_i1.p1  ORF type:complete len:351 (-),score=41.46 TRINITY_DN15607_c0_g1_i1:385-1371(-)
MSEQAVKADTGGSVDPHKRKAKQDSTSRSSKKGKYAKAKESVAVFPPGEWGFLISSDPAKERRARQEMVHLLLKAKENIESQTDVTTNVKNQENTEQKQEEKKQPEQTNGTKQKVENGKQQLEQNEKNEESKKDASNSEEQKSVNMGQALEEELKSLKSDKLFESKEISQGMSFLKMRRKDGVPDPTQLCHNLLSEVYETSQSQARFCIKILPIMYSCYASIDAIQKLAGKVVAENFCKDDETQTFAVHYDHRFGPNLERMAVIDAFANLVPSPTYKVDLNNPDKTILVQILKNSCGVSIVKDWRKFMKYNLREIVRIKSEQAGAVKD